jgi:hypothetical protein
MSRKMIYALAALGWIFVIAAVVHMLDPATGVYDSARHAFRPEWKPAFLFGLACAPIAGLAAALAVRRLNRKD